MADYATLQDITTLWRPLTPAEEPRAQALLSAVSSALRVEARKAGRDLDSMVASDADLASTAASVTVDVVSRTLMTATDREPLTQFSETVGSYSASGTFLVPGGGLFIKKTELARLGLRRQRFGTINLFDVMDGERGGVDG